MGQSQQREGEGEICRCCPADFEDGGRGPEPRNVSRAAPEAEQRKETILLLSLWWDHDLAGPWFQPGVTDFILLISRAKRE